MKEYSEGKAARSLHALVKEAELGEHIAITRGGEPTAVLLSLEEFSRPKAEYESTVETARNPLSAENRPASGQATG
jgi:prevent-host-death family protein